MRPGKNVAEQKAKSIGLGILTINRKTYMMRMLFVCGGFCLALLLLPCACSNSTQSDKLPPMQIQGVNADIPQLSAQFANAAPVIQSRVNEGILKVRYNQ